MWQKEYSVETKASPEAIWKIFVNVQSWPKWIAGLQKAEISSAFLAGTEYIITPVGQGPVSARIIELKENEYFIDESRHGDTIIRIIHRIEKIDRENSRIIYSAQITGPGAEEFGKAVTSDFPDVLKSLAKFAESGNAS